LRIVSHHPVPRGVDILDEFDKIVESLNHRLHATGTPKPRPTVFDQVSCAFERGAASGRRRRSPWAFDETLHSAAMTVSYKIR
jgi:hypothetical protein